MTEKRRLNCESVPRICSGLFHSFPLFLKLPSLPLQIFTLFFKAGIRAQVPSPYVYHHCTSRTFVQYSLVHPLHTHIVQKCEVLLLLLLLVQESPSASHSVSVFSESLRAEEGWTCVVQESTVPGCCTS